MEINKTVYCVVFLLTILSVNAQNNAKFVNTFIGTDGTGHTFPGPSLPFGMVQLSPDTRLEGWDGCSGYHYSDSIIFGFSFYRIIKYLNEKKNKEIIFRLNNKNNGTMEYIKGHFIITQV